MPPTPLQNSQEDFEVEDQIWSARDRTVIARTKQYLEESESLKVEVEELKSLLGPDDLDADFRRILNEARNKKGRTIFETCSSDAPSEFLAVSRARLDEHQRRLTSTIIAWSTEEVKVREETEDYLERSAEIKVDTKALERLMERGRAEVCLRCILKNVTRRGSNILQLFDTGHYVSRNTGKSSSLS